MWEELSIDLILDNIEEIISENAQTLFCLSSFVHLEKSSGVPPFGKPMDFITNIKWDGYEIISRDFRYFGRK